MKITNDRLLIGICIIIGTIISIAFQMSHRNIILGRHFKGVMQEISYTPQHHPLKARISGIQYNLTNYFWNNDFDINIGDTIIKNSGDNRIKLVRRNSADTIFFDTNKKDPVKWVFSGIVQNEWTDKYTVYVIVNGREYEFDYENWTFDKQINKGDLIIKKRSEPMFKIISKSSNDTATINYHKE